MRAISASHGQDLAYWFDTVDLSPAVTPAAREVAGKMSDTLVAFARAGNPSIARPQRLRRAFPNGGGGSRQSVSELWSN
jgi:carboxylesterase type B